MYTFHGMDARTLSYAELAAFHNAQDLARRLEADRVAAGIVAAADEESDSWVEWFNSITGKPERIRRDS